MFGRATIRLGIGPHSSLHYFQRSLRLVRAVLLIGCWVVDFTQRAWCMLWPAVCLSVCLSQVGVLSKRLNGWSWFSAHTNYSPLVRLENSCIYKTKTTWRCNFLPNSKLCQFSAFLPQYVDYRKCYVNWVDHRKFYRSERPTLLTTLWSWRTASCG